MKGAPAAWIGVDPDVRPMGVGRKRGRLLIGLEGGEQRVILIPGIKLIPGSEIVTEQRMELMPK